MIYQRDVMYQRVPNISQVQSTLKVNDEDAPVRRGGQSTAEARDDISSLSAVSTNHILVFKS